MNRLTCVAIDSDMADEIMNKTSKRRSCALQRKRGNEFENSRVLSQQAVDFELALESLVASNTTLGSQRPPQNVMNTGVSIL
jgi:hypothetical protein